MDSQVFVGYIRGLVGGVGVTQGDLMKLLFEDVVLGGLGGM